MTLADRLQGTAKPAFQQPKNRTLNKIKEIEKLFLTIPAVDIAELPEDIINKLIAAGETIVKVRKALEVKT